MRDRQAAHVSAVRASAETMLDAAKDLREKSRRMNNKARSLEHSALRLQSQRKGKKQRQFTPKRRGFIRRPKTMPNQTEPTFGQRIYEKLNRPRHGKYQNSSGAYIKHERSTIGLKQFGLHLEGVDSIAISAVDGEKANFLAVDVDAEFERRLPIFANVLRRKGLDRASFATSGSSPGRGKVVTTLAQRLPQRQAINIVKSIVGEATTDAAFGEYKLKDITAWPLGGDGGYARLFGRNGGRTATRALDAPLDLNGDLSDLYYLEPAQIAPDVGRTCSRSSLSSWAQGFVEGPYSGRTPDLWTAQVRLAYEAVSLYGVTKAADFLTDAFRAIEAQSPDLSSGSRRNLTRPDVVKKLIEYASSSKSLDGKPYILDLVWLPKENIEASRPAVRVYRALVEYVSLWGLDPNCIGVTYERIADLSGYAGKAKAWSAIQKAVKAGLIAVLDPGMPKADGLPGLCGLYALVGNHNNPSQALVAGRATPMYETRCAEREARTKLTALRSAKSLRRAA